MSDAAPAVSVVIPHYEQPDDLGRTLDSLAAQTGAPPFEVLVVDNGSAALPEAVCAGRPLVRLLSETAKGPGPARSTGAGAARAPLLAFIDADCLADPDWLAVIADRFAAAPGAAVLGGDVRIQPADPGRWTAIECYEAVYGYRQQLFVERDHYAATCNMAVRRAVFEAVGPFAGLDRAEDMDWGARAHAAGHRIVYVPEMRIATPARARFAELARKFDRQLGHDYAPVRGRPGRMAAWALKTLAMPVSPLAEIPRIAGTDRLAGARARAACFACLVRTRAWRTRRMAELLLGRDARAMAEGWRRTTS